MIDFADPRNLIFFLIVLIFAAIIIAIFFIILRAILRLIKNIFKKLFVRKSLTQRPAPQTQNSAPRPQPQPQPSPQYTQQQYTQQEKNFSTPKQPPMPAGKPSPNEPAIGPATEIDEKQEFEEESEKDIEAGLAKLKTSGSAGEQTLESKMPSREIKTEEENIVSAKIEIPKAPKFRTEERPHQTKNVIEQNQPSKISAKISTKIPVENKNIDDYLEKPDISKEILEIKNPEEKSKEEKSKEENLAKTNQKAATAKQAGQSRDSSIFEGKEEISRIDLRQKLRKDPKVWNAQRQAGLSLSPIERANLEKEVFSSALGRNISRSDLKAGVRKLGQKMLSAKNPQEHAKIRKEINFFKKIGGIR